MTEMGNNLVMRADGMYRCGNARPQGCARN